MSLSEKVELSHRTHNKKAREVLISQIRDIAEEILAIWSKIGKA